MEISVVLPPAELSPWVASGMHVELDSPGTAPIACHFPALVEGGLTLVLQGQFFLLTPSGGFTPLPAGFVSSANAQPLTLYRSPRLRCVGLRLRPAGTIGLLQSSPLSLPHQIADAKDVFGPPWYDWVERLQSAAAPSACLALLMGFAADSLCRHTHFQRLRRITTLQHAALRMATPQEAVGLSVRQFEREFAGTFGLSPKLFQRVARMEELLRDALRTGRSGAGLALHHGYYDQSHMARDLRALAGAPLGTLLDAARLPDSERWALTAGAMWPETPA